MNDRNNHQSGNGWRLTRLNFKELRFEHYADFRTPPSKIRLKSSPLVVLLSRVKYPKGFNCMSILTSHCRDM